MFLQCLAVREWESLMTDILVVKKEVSKCEHEQITAASPTHKHILNQYSCPSQTMYWSPQNTSGHMLAAFICRSDLNGNMSKNKKPLLSLFVCLCVQVLTCLVDNLCSCMSTWCYVTDSFWLLCLWCVPFTYLAFTYLIDLVITGSTPLSHSFSYSDMSQIISQSQCRLMFVKQLFSIYI